MSVKASSSIRTEQAAHTRRRVLEAAARVLERQGFAGTRIADVATEAGVAVPTVYKVFTNKVNLLIGAVNQTMAGDDAAPIDQQAWFTEQLDEPDPVRQLRLVARNARRMYERAGPLLNVLPRGRATQCSPRTGLARHRCATTRPQSRHRQEPRHQGRRSPPALTRRHRPHTSGAQRTRAVQHVHREQSNGKPVRSVARRHPLPITPPLTSHWNRTHRIGLRLPIPERSLDLDIRTRPAP